MCLLLETMKIRNGEICNLEYHNRRFNSSRREKYGINQVADLGSLLAIPEDLGPGIFQCRVLYGQEIEKLEFIPYEKRIIRSLKIVTADTIDYSHKYADRKLLESLFEKRGECDEILILKNGFISDTSISNIVFQRTDGSWVTPDTPLLNGTMRMFLLETERISEAPVKPGDLGSYTAARMINCMMDLDGSPLIDMDNIIV